MNMIIENGVLIRCTADSASVRIPETVTEIAADAFAQNEPGTIRQLYLPDSLRTVHIRSFSGLGKLERLSVHSCSPEEAYDAEERWIDEGGGHPVIETRELWIMPGFHGNCFYLDQWFDRLPEEIAVYGGLGLFYYPGTPASDIGSEGFQDVRILNVYGNGIYKSDTGILSRLPYGDNVKVLRLINSCLIGTRDGIPESEYRIGCFGGDMTGLRKRVTRVTEGWNDLEWEWRKTDSSALPGVSEWPCLEKIVLPEGLTELDSDFQRCPSLKKIVLPPTVKKIGGYAFRECTSLRSIAVSAEGDPDLTVSAGAFLDCPSFRYVLLYEGNPLTGVKKTVRKIPADVWLKEHYMRQMITEYEEKYPDLVQESRRILEYGKNKFGGQWDTGDLLNRIVRETQGAWFDEYMGNAGKYTDEQLDDQEKMRDRALILLRSRIR